MITPRLAVAPEIVLTPASCQPAIQARNSPAVAEQLRAVAKVRQMAFGVWAISRATNAWICRQPVISTGVPSGRKALISESVSFGKRMQP